jgi:hypothetical protein
MPKGPKGEKRPADVIGNAVKVMRIATGEISDDVTAVDRAKAGRAGGRSRALRLTKSEREAIARSGAQARWDDDDTS